MKYFFGARVYEKVNNCLVFLICYLQVRKKLCSQNFCSIEKQMMLEISNKNVLQVLRPDSCDLSMICEIHVFY